jgi:hypothetical protein
MRCFGQQKRNSTNEREGEPLFQEDSSRRRKLACGTSNPGLDPETDIVERVDEVRYGNLSSECTLTAADSSSGTGRCIANVKEVLECIYSK